MKLKDGRIYVDGEGNVFLAYRTGLMSGNLIGMKCVKSVNPVISVGVRDIFHIDGQLGSGKRKEWNICREIEP